MSGSIIGSAGTIFFFLNYRLDYWSGHGRTNRTVCYGPVCSFLILYLVVIPPPQHHCPMHIQYFIPRILVVPMYLHRAPMQAYNYHRLECHLASLAYFLSHNTPPPLHVFLNQREASFDFNQPHTFGRLVDATLH